MNINRIILIGNGFDLAHGLKTSYNDFINQIQTEELESISEQLNGVRDTNKSHSFNTKFFTITYQHSFTTEHELSFFIEKPSFEDLIKLSKKGILNIVSHNNFFLHCFNQKKITNWVDFEAEYFSKLNNQQTIKDAKQLNQEFDDVKNVFEEYLTKVTNQPIKTIITEIKNILDSDISIKELSSKYIKVYKEQEQAILKEIKQHQIQHSGHDEFIFDEETITTYQEEQGHLKQNLSDHTTGSIIPNTLVLNFNYTHTPEEYQIRGDNIKFLHIHGELKIPSNPIIFGYGDERCDEYHKLELHGDNEYFKHIKSFAYSNTNNYKELIAFIESNHYELFILGHSCGLSDRTLLSTLFEHDNCISIKPFYYQSSNSDSYQDTIMNISRSFKDKAKMRDILVNKTQTEAYSK